MAESASDPWREDLDKACDHRQSTKSGALSRLPDLGHGTHSTRLGSTLSTFEAAGSLSNAASE